MRLIVVGGGIVGAACAYTASSLGAQVTLIDAGRDGQATAAGAGIICPWSDPAADPARYALACAAAREYPALVAELAERGEPDVSYRQVGALLSGRLAELAEAALRRLRSGARPRRRWARCAGCPVAEARELFPPLGPVPAAVHIGGAARVDGRRMAAALAQGARSRRGARGSGRGDGASWRGAGRGRGRPGCGIGGELDRGRCGGGRDRGLDRGVPGPAGAAAPAWPARRDPGARADRAHLAGPGRHQPLAGHPARRQRPLPAGLRRLAGRGGRHAGAGRGLRLPGHARRAWPRCWRGTGAGPRPGGGHVPGDQGRLPARRGPAAAGAGAGRRRAGRGHRPGRDRAHHGPLLGVAGRPGGAGRVSAHRPDAVCARREAEL